MDLEAKVIRTVWNFVETASPYNLIKLSDGELIQQLIEEVEPVFSLSSHESEKLANYIGARTILIRDLVYSKID